MTPTDHTLDAAEQKLVARNVQPTAMRILVMRYLMEQITAVSLTDIEEGFAQSDRVTLYRTLKTFEKKGIVHAIADGTITRYALCPDDCETDTHVDAHLHFQCMLCDRLYCLPAITIPTLNLPANYSVSELNLTARGICNACQPSFLQ